MKTILHISSATTWRGAEQQIDYIINQQNSVYNQVLFAPENSELSKKNKDKTITFKKRFGVDFLAAIQLKKLCNQNKIDLIHLHDSHAINTFIFASFLGLNIPGIIHRHVNFPIKNKWKYRFKKIQKIICVSKEVKKNFIPFIDAEKLEIVYPGIDIKKFENDKIPKIEKNKKKFTVGIVSAIEHEKNIEEFIEIANTISSKRNDISFEIIGDGSLKTIYEKKHSNIKFLGFQQNIPQQFSMFDVFLFTSKNEGFGQVLIESMAAKVPIITNNFAAANEIIEHEKTGYIYKDVDNAVDLIQRILTTYESRIMTTTNAFNFVQQFDITLMNKKIVNIYNSIFTNHQ